MAVRPSAATPAVTQDPHQQVRDLVTRYFFGTAAGVALVAALVFSLVPPNLTAGHRLLLAVVYLGLMALSLAAMRVQPRHLNRALLGVALGVIGAILVASSTLQWGLNSPSMGFFALITCMVGGVAGWRSAVVVAVACVLAMAGLATAEAQGWIAGAQAAVRLPMAVRLVSHAFVMSAGVAAGVLLSLVVGRFVEASSEREKRFLGLLWIAADAYWEMDADFRLVAMWEQRSGSRDFTPVRRPPGTPPWEMPRLQFEEDVLDLHRADLEARRPFRDLHARWTCRDGSVRHVLISGEPRFDARGMFSGYWGVARDATGDIQAHHALARTEERYHDLFNHIPTPLVLQRGGQVIDANPAAVELFGHDSLPTLGEDDLLQAYEAGDDRERARQALRRLETLPVGQMLPPEEFRLRSRSGRRLVVRATGVRVEAEGGPATLSMFLDETERKAAEDAVRGSEALLSHLVATSPDVITLTDLSTGRYAMVNDTFCRLLGFRSEEVIGRTSFELHIWKNAHERERIVRELREHSSVQNMPAEFNVKDGGTISLLVSAARFVMDGKDYLVINARDVTEAERTRKANEAILQNASIGIAFTRDQRFVQANAACEQIFGWPPGELVGQPGTVVWPSTEDYEAAGREIGPALAQGLQIETERTMARRDGSTFLCRILAKAVDPQQPRTGGTIWILDDVTERRLMDQALAKARDDAEAASRAKSAFLANTSHELRTPLNGLMGLTRLARQPDLPEGQREHFLEQIADSAETLSAIINDILDLSKIEAGKLHVETLAFDLYSLVNTLQRAYGALAEARALGFTVEIAPDVPRHVLGDPVRVRQILANYLANALKFTTQGTIGLVVRQVTHGLVRFEVHDTGPGIDPAVQERLFRPFTQADQSTTRRFGGTGLGLSICHELASLMGGTVGVRSRVGAGSCFWAELPLVPTHTEEILSGFGTLESTGPMAGARLLLVEDNPVNMMVAAALLEQWGAKVTQASTGQQAIDAVEQSARKGQLFDAVLMDVQMPEMSGREATRRLRQRYDAKTLPIIALTAAALVSEREEALAAGMNDFLTKPIDPGRLRATLAAVLEGRRRG